MNSIKCAVCKKKIKDFDHYLVIGYGIPLPLYSLCDTCGRPVIELLESHNLRSFSDEQGISWKSDPERAATELLDLDPKRVHKRRRSAKPRS